MADIKIIVDSGSDIPEETAKQYDISVLPFMVVFGEQYYKIGVDITTDEFYRRLKQSEEIPTTSQTPYEDMKQMLLEESKKHESVIFFTLSSKGSGQNATAHMVKNEILEEDNPNADIHIVDSMSYSIFIAMGAVFAAQLAREGKTASEIAEAAKQYIDSWDAYILVDSLKYLEKGGRLGRTSAVIGSLLDIKPVLAVRDGLIAPIDKLRGKKKLIAKLIEKIKENPKFDAQKEEFAIVHSDEAQGQAMLTALKDAFGIDNVMMYSQISPVIGTHIGPGTVAVLFRKKEGE